MRVLLFLPFPPDSPTGNAVTARRIRGNLAPMGIEVLLRHLPAEAGLDAVLGAIDRERPDVLQWYNAWKTGRWLPQARRARSLPSVITLTGTDINREAVDPSHRETVLAALRESEAILTYSSALRDHAIALLPELASRIHTIPKGVELGTARYEMPAWARGDVVLFLLPAGVRPEKNNRFAVRALEAVHTADPRVRLLLAGPVIDAAYAAELRQDLATHPWAGHIDHIPHEAMASLYAQAAVVLNTSLSEGLANSVIEAMACGRPVLASDIEGNRQVVTHGETGLLYCNEADFAAKASQLASDAALRERLGAAGRTTAERRHSTSSEASALYRVLVVASLRHSETGRNGRVYDLRGWRGVLAARWRLASPPEDDSARRASAGLPVVLEARGAGLGADQATEATRSALVEDAAGIAGRVVWEVGCGTGVLATVAARLGAKEVWATDVDDQALALARQTWERNGVAVHSMRASLMEAEIRADVVIANLPQKPVPHGVEVSLAHDGGPDGSRLLLPLVEQAGSRLPRGGWLYLFLHSLASPAVLDRLLEGFDVSVCMSYARPFVADEFVSLLPYWRELRALGRCLFSERDDGGGEFWCAVLRCVRR